MASKTAKKPAKKITLRDRKRSQPDAVKYFSEDEKLAIRESVAKNLTKDQIKIFFYQCQALGLNPLVNEICAISYAGKMSIQVMRDGFLTIAHRSGLLAGMESGVTMSEDGTKIVNGWAKVYHKNFKVPMYQEADFDEYNSGRNLWTTKPKTMIKKVAESMALRKAFNVSGVYSPEEMDKEIQVTTPEVKKFAVPGGDRPATKEQIATIDSLSGTKTIDTKMTKQEASEAINKLSQKK